MLLSEILKGITYTSENFGDVDVKDIVYDSKKADKDTIFVCLVGVNVDAHKFAKNAYDNGARIFLCQKSLELPQDACIITVKNTRETLADMSCNFFRHPSKQIKVVGVTGTKGKTTVANLIKESLQSVGIKSGSIGTIGAWYGDKQIDTVHQNKHHHDKYNTLNKTHLSKSKITGFKTYLLNLLNT